MKIILVILFLLLVFDYYKFSNSREKITNNKCDYPVKEYLECLFDDDALMKQERWLECDGIIKCYQRKKNHDHLNLRNISNYFGKIF